MKKLLAIALAALMILSVCTFAVAEEETLTVWFSVWCSRTEKEMAQEDWRITKIAQDFEAAHPGVKVDMVYFSDQQVAMNKLKASVMAGDAPDIINMYTGYPVYAVSEVLEDITEYIPAEDKEILSGWAGVEFDGKTYGYPVNTNEAYGILYNKSLVKAAGLDFEANPPKNAAELYDAMAAIKATGVLPFVSDAGGYNALFVFDFSSFWSQISGVERITADSLATEKFAEDEGFLKALQYAADMYKDGFVNEDYETCKEATTRFFNGEAAMAPGGINDDNIAALGDDLGMIAVPDYDETVAFPGYNIGGAGQVACVVKGANAALATEFLSFVNNRENTLYMLADGGLPLRSDITASDLGFDADPRKAAYLEIANTHSWNWNDNSLQSDVGNEFYTLSTMAVTGQITVEECAEQLDQIAADVAENY